MLQKLMVKKYIDKCGVGIDEDIAALRRGLASLKIKLPTRSGPCCDFPDNPLFWAAHTCHTWRVLAASLWRWATVPADAAVLD